MLGHMITLFQPAVLGGAPAPFTPAALFAGGIKGGFWNPKQLSTLYNDRSQTPSTLAISTSLAGTIKDLSGNNNHLVASADSRRPQIQPWGSINRSSHNNTNPTLPGEAWLGPVNILGGVTQAYRCYIRNQRIRAKWYDTNDFRAYCMLQMAAGDLDFELPPSDKYTVFGSTAVKQVNVTNTFPNDGLAHIIEEINNGTTITIYIDGVQFGTPQAITYDMSVSKPSLGGDATFRFAGYGGACVILGRLPTSQERIDLRVWMASEYLQGSEPTRRVIACDGDSLTFGFGASQPWFAYPQDMWRDIGGNYNVYNLGVTGNTAVQAQAANRTGPLFETNGIAVISEVINALVQGHSVVNTYNEFATWSAFVRAQGYKVVVWPAADAGVVPDADRLAVNALIRANWPSFADAIADVDLDPTIGLSGTHTNPTYFLDGTHLTDAGNVVLKNIIKPVVLAIP